MRRRKPLPPRTQGDVLRDFPALRQSTLATFTDCMLAALFQLEGGGRWTNDAQARGTIFHATAARILRTLQATGQVSMPPDQGLQILYEVLAQRDVPVEDVVIPSAVEQRMLRMLVVRFCRDNEFGMRRLIAVERRLECVVTYPHPETGLPVERVISGQPDALIASPPSPTNPVIKYEVLDWKTTRKAPPPRDPEKDAYDDADHLSHLGYFQQRSYGLLVLKNYPLAECVELREFYPFEEEGNQLRTSVLWRERDEERLEREFANYAELFDRGLREGSNRAYWKPSAGLHCRYCTRPASCPIDSDERIQAGGIVSHAEARRAGAHAIQAREIYKAIRPGLKAWFEEHGVPIPVQHPKGRYEWRERPNKTGNGKSFDCYEALPQVSEPRDLELEAAVAEARERVSA